MIKNLKGECWKHYTNNYFVSNQGRIKHVFKNGKEKLLTPYNHQKIIKVKINGKAVNFPRVVYTLFKEEVPEGYFVVHKNRARFDNSINNLILMTNKELGINYGHKSAKWRIHDKTNGCYYRSTRDAEKKLHLSRQSISDICNNKTKKPLYNLVWVKD